MQSIDIRDLCLKSYSLSLITSPRSMGSLSQFFMRTLMLMLNYFRHSCSICNKSTKLCLFRIISISHLTLLFRKVGSTKTKTSAKTKTVTLTRNPVTSTHQQHPVAATVADCHWPNRRRPSRHRPGPVPTDRPVIPSAGAVSLRAEGPAPTNTTSQTTPMVNTGYSGKMEY